VVRYCLVLVLLGVLAPALAACSQGAGNTTPGAILPAAVPRPKIASVGTYIKHVVIVIQENRTFTSIFEGYPGADTRLFGFTHDHKRVRLTPMPFFQDQDLRHNFADAIRAWADGSMNGFDLNDFDNGAPAGRYPYSYVSRGDTGPYWEMAARYTLADRMFPTEFGPSFTSHLALIAGTMNLSPTLAEANYPLTYPWGCDAPSTSFTDTVNEQRIVLPNGPAPCFTQFRTMADTLDARHVSWKYYAPGLEEQGGTLWTSFDAIHHVRYGPDWTRNIVTPQTTVLTDAAQGRLASVSWVIPDWLDSDHPAADSDTGPSWVANVVNAVGKSKDWKTTAIVIVWDDWGGWYDNVPPPQHDFRGNGVRVGCLIVSPYSRKGYVSHTVYEFGSILKFVEQAFDLAPVGPTSKGYTDTRATSIVDSFDFSQKPRGFVPIAAKYSATYFLERPASGRAPDDE
jgi:phospholipase C